VDPVPDPLLSLQCPGIEPGTSGYVAGNSDHYTKEVAIYYAISETKYVMSLTVSKSCTKLIKSNNK
jgi:hypothetical protein